MERFREHEKEFKLKPFSKKAIASASKDANGNYIEGEYGDEDDEDYSGEEGNYSMGGDELGFERNNVEG